MIRSADNELRPILPPSTECDVEEQGSANKKDEIIEKQGSATLKNKVVQPRNQVTKFRQKQNIDQGSVSG